MPDSRKSSNPDRTHRPRSLLTPAMHSVLERMARAGAVPLHALNPQQARQAYEAGAGLLDNPPHKLLRVEDFWIPTRDGQTIGARLYLPDGLPGQLPEQAPLHASSLPVLVYFHGGGFTIGSIETHDTLCRSLCHLAHCAVVSVNYRLAPEHRFPVAVNDAFDAVQWVASNASALQVDANRLAVGGDSAGGTLAAVCAILARDAGLPLALQLLIYPGTTAHQDTPSHQIFAKGFLLEQTSINYFFDHYIDRSDRDDWRFAPLNAPDLQGLAPAWLGLAECDPLFDEGLMYGDALRLAGVPVDLEIYKGVVHGFITMRRALPEARQAHQDAAKALRQAFQTSL